MEIDERFLTLLTPEGEFLKARKQAQDYSIGEEIHFFPITEAEKKRFFFSKFSFGKALPAAALALIVAGATLIPFNTNDEVYAYMSIDVNPSIELAVNDELEVVDVEAYNPEGEQILANIKDWNHTEVSVVTTNIIKEIKKQGFLEENNQVVISTVLEEDKEKKVEEKLEANLHQIEEKIEKENVEMTVISGTKQERKAAVKQGVTTGIYKEKTKKAEIKLDEEVEKKESKQEKKQDQPTKPSENNGNKDTKGKAKDDKQEKDNGKQPPGQQKKLEKENNKDGKGKSDEKVKQSKKNLPNQEDKKDKGKDNGNNNKEKKQDNKKDNNKNKAKKDEKDKPNKSKKDAQENNND
jgi:hypothetical protein